MKPYYQQIDLEHKGCEFAVEVYYNFYESQYNDEVQGSEADYDLDDLYHPRKGKPLSQRLRTALISKYNDCIHQHIIEHHGECHG